MRNVEITYKLITPDGASKPTNMLIEGAETTAEGELIFAKAMALSGLTYEVTLNKLSRISEVIRKEDYMKQE